ncbi:MAG: hypothetical protein ACFB16_15630 [Phormidesmis sp.]
MKLQNKVAIVTGGSGGIRQGICRYMTGSTFCVDGGLLWNYQEQ